MTFTPEQVQAYRAQLLYTMQQLVPIFIAPLMAIELATPEKMGELVRKAITNCRITSEAVLKEAYSAPVPSAEPLPELPRIAT